MPYEIIVARQLPGESWPRTIERIEEGADILPRPLSADRVECWDRAADRIVGANVDTPTTGLNRMEIRTTAPTVQIVLEENAAFVSIPSWHGADDARSAMARVADIVRILAEETGWPIWDQQLGREPVLPDDLTGEGAEILDAGGASLDAGDESTAGGGSDRPWWRFWRP